jgi:hypothetical protein
VHLLAGTPRPRALPKYLIGMRNYRVPATFIRLIMKSKQVPAIVFSILFFAVAVVLPTASGATRSSLIAHPSFDGEKYRLGWQGILFQGNQNTCGPATIVNLLRLYYDKPKAQLEPLLQNLDYAEKGINLETFEALAREQGILGDWLKTKNLKAIDELPKPAVVHLNIGTGHYAIVQSSWDGYVFVLDSLRGRTLYPTASFLKIWSGRAFVLTNLPRGNI